MPFLKRNQDSANVGLIVKHRAPDESNESEDKDDPSAAHEACAREILSAVKSDDPKRLAEALQDLFNILDSEPHEEGPHTYDAQNEKAGKQE